MSAEISTPFGINELLAMPRQCGWCGMIHGPMCPRIQAIEYYPNGTVKRVEFITIVLHPGSCKNREQGENV
jgi:hypothetical protein